MALSRFKTDRRLWFGVSLILFVVPWFVFEFGKGSDPDHPIILWQALITQPSHFAETLTFIAIFTLAFGIPALAVGWAIHCLLVMIRDSFRKRTRNAG